MAELKPCPACNGRGCFGNDTAGRPWRCINCGGTGKADGFGSFAHHFSERPADGVDLPDGGQR